MKANEALEIYSILRNCSIGTLNGQAKVDFILMTIKLKGFYEGFEKARVEISEQTKPEGWEDGDDTTTWDKSFKPVMDGWLLENKCDVVCNILSADDFGKLSFGDMPIDTIVYLYEKLVK